MATLVLQAAGSVLGGFLGGPVGAVVGRAIGGIAGSFVDEAILGSATRKVEGPRINRLQVLSSTPGTAIPKIYGRMRVAGQIIWATRFEEVISTRSEKSGSKGGIGGKKTKITEYSYYANFAVGLCQGKINRIGRVWADGKEIDPGQYNYRIYDGAGDQQPDSLIIAKEGSDVPGFRGVAYVVFEQIALERFGNRIPQLSFEVFKASGEVEKLVTAMNIIPGSTEFGYDSEPVSRTDGWGGIVTENRHTRSQLADWSVSIDDLQSTCENIGAVSLVVSWFGDDLRCAETRIRPGIENRDKQTIPHSWQCAGQTRDNAYLLSRHNGSSAFGGTPDDTSVIRAIRDLGQRGLRVMFYPFIMMDIEAGNNLPNPVDGTTGQPAYPWRGQISCDPIPGRNQTPDKTSAITSQVDAFFGSAQPDDFTASGDQIIYSGPDEWSLRRMVLHYAHLCAAAGGVEAFLIASELPGMTMLRDENDRFRAVEALTILAGDVAGILPQTKISYAADWSEYFGYHPQDGSGDVYFHLDDFWSDSNVDFIGIDNYMPLSDWRDGGAHLDAAAGNIYDREYLAGNIAGGEGYEWYYANMTDRQLQRRSPINDGAYGKPWVFRYKDLVNWWSRPHFNRPGGIEAASPTSWIAQSKPVWFTELGCPAIDKGTNQPNVFNDPKSSQGAMPYFSSGSRDDFIQRRFVEVHMQHWSKAGSHNPLSAVYGGTMVDPQSIFLWAWDARPYPAFPYLQSVWSDGENYHKGHWLNGRLGSVSLAALVAEVLDDFGFADYLVDGLNGVVDGYAIERIMSARQAIEGLSNIFPFSATESEGLIKFTPHDRTAIASINRDLMVETGPDKPLLNITRGQETELADIVKLAFVDAADNYSQNSVDARKLTGYSRREALLEAAIAMPEALASSLARIKLHESWTGRTSASIVLPPSMAEIEPGDIIDVESSAAKYKLRIETVSDGTDRTVTARACNLQDYHNLPDEPVAVNMDRAVVFGPPLYEILDLPLLAGNFNPVAQWIAATADPWPGSLVLLESSGSGFTAIAEINSPAIIGETRQDFPAGPLYRFDKANQLHIYLPRGALHSISKAELLNGGNIAAIGDNQSGWEIIQFQDVLQLSAHEFILTGMLRGQAGSNSEMPALRPSGARFILLDAAVIQIPATTGDIGRERLLRLGPSGLDHGDSTFVDMKVTSKGLGYRPYSPVHLSAVRMNDAIDLRWQRRTRIDGDGWQQVQVPLGEEIENYQIDILSGQAVVRSMNSTATSVEYTNAQRLEDFGSPLPGELQWRVAQISTIFGAGAFMETISNV